MTRPFCPKSRLLVLAGPSCSGKSTVARIVAEWTGARLLHLDARWIKGCHKPLVGGEPSYERPEQYDGAALAAEARSLLGDGSGAPVVVEGFLAMCYPEVLELGGVRVLLDLSEAEIEARRRARAALEGDPSGGGKRSAAERAWLANGILEWRAHGAPQASVPGVTLIPADADPMAVAKSVLACWHAGTRDTPRVWLHRARRTTYIEVGRAVLQASTGPVAEGATLVVYRDLQGGLHAREQGEFGDGRFADLDHGMPSETADCQTDPREAHGAESYR